MSDGDQEEPPSKQPPTPEELTRRLADFMKQNFGGQDLFSGIPGFDGPERRRPETRATAPPPGGEDSAVADIQGFDLLPRDIKAHLDRFVIRQDEAKKVLSIAVCDHYNHAREMRRLEADDPRRAREIEYAKNNVIIVGPTGVGKTYLVKHIADLIGVPFVKADATKFSETGYVGGDVDDLVRELVQRADGDVELAEYGIIYIDEIDKLASQSNAMGRDVSGRGVQTTLLKLMEDTEVPVRNPSDIQGQMQAMFDLQRGKGPSRRTVRTRHILFIVSGAFSGLERIVAKRLKSGTIGFGRDASDTPMDEALFQEVSTRDFMDFGFEAEFIGRLPVRVVCEPLTEDDLFEILKRSEGSLVRQYEREFDSFGITARFSDGALRRIAAGAAKEETGARGLMTVCERLLRDFKFELPGTAVREIEIDEGLVDAPSEALRRYRELGRQPDTRRVAGEVGAWLDAFAEDHGIRLRFTEAAVRRLGERAMREGIAADVLCGRLFRDFPFGLKLVVANGGAADVELGREAVDEPDRFLSDLVVKSYREASPSPGSEPGESPGSGVRHDGEKAD